MSDDQDLRGLVLDAALAQALRVMDVVREHGLSGGSISETVDVDGTDWHLNATYVHDQDAVRVFGHPAPPDAETGEEVVARVARAFGIGSGSNGQFDWSMPAQWLEAAGRPTTAGS